ncbi:MULTISPECIES: pyruvate dehydrogenase (acetyl-transferring), homodimeric type [Achromobacter]|uniref:Pyruvate dehydrogenase E1 component n=1 Tax=Achromobacter spanius TaxID=217203 RepID=A0ABY8GUZ7_9BURK|nr:MULTISPECIES: pyruvate dehydrogenase (acetyl-transferring), homodimeric type [Achromobacter]WAI82205.1 pyruvate dehydrogenase (acetyl-transferring), homodimeric type [Achromobacter spanius]WEX92293.1 pyruvate dehydrogenase (acetyl-transferring), homodimeric type [Achromobacter sp. SS2-2022]WFP08557.1 pyruvate dehydrogenase (acetyl-transferring), homodimeric type [Achromobacter spanius]
MDTPIDSTDADPQETQEWLEAMQAVLAHEGRPRTHYLLDQLIQQDRADNGRYAAPGVTPYVNTISAACQPAFPGDIGIEQRLDAYLRWNAMAMVLRAGKTSGVGGHIATYASATTLYETGYRHFFRAATPDFLGDLLYIQGHSAPGIYARAYLEGRISEAQLDGFRREIGGGGLASYPHPRTMPAFWQFPTVSMGLGPLMAAYQARYMRYLEDRGLIPAQGRKVWGFLGDGEQDQPETLAAVAMAGREKLDNLIFVVNCNLQRLDGPVRGNAKIIQELESVYRGAGWNVIKVVWGAGWDALLAQDHDGRLRRRMMQCVDGEYQVFKSRGGAYVREHFFGVDEVLLERVAHLSDEEIGALNRGGHDPAKVHAAYAAAVAHRGQPTVILAKTVKGYGMGAAGEAANTNHQQKKMADPAVRAFRDRFAIAVPDDQLEQIPYIKPTPGSAEHNYFQAAIARAGGHLPNRSAGPGPLATPPLAAFAAHLKGSDGREFSSTMAFVRVLAQLLKDPEIGLRVIPIVPDESRTFGMDGMFRQVGIYSHVGQLYTPQDADQLSVYREDRKGQILQEGINESGAMSSWIAAGTAHSTHGLATIPFYIFYSMFGFQRVGDLAWAAGDIRARGFLLGATSGRTTLEGEGLQHDDGHSHVLASVIPSCRAYDPAYAYEIAVIVQDGLRRMYQDGEDVFYYLTLVNEKTAHPPMPDDAQAGILQGMYRLRQGEPGELRVQLLGSGAILAETLAAADLLRQDFGVSADVWSVTSYSELMRDGQEVERWNRLHPQAQARRGHAETALAASVGPVVAATDYMKTVPEQIRPFVAGRRYVTLGTDGFGRSDTRHALRSFFGVDRHHIALAALKALADEGRIDPAQAALAIARYGIDAEAVSAALP